MYRTYSYNDMPIPAKKKSESVKSEIKSDTANKETRQDSLTQQLPEKKHKEPENKGLLANLKTDDIILIAIALVLLTDGCDDKILLAAIAYIFISEFL